MPMGSFISPPPTKWLKLRLGISPVFPISSLVGIDADALGDALRYEPSRGGALFPHLYGDLRLDAVRSVTDLPIGPDGRHLFPADLVSPTPPSTGASA